jgi:hypothetical protein
MDPRYRLQWAGSAVDYNAEWRCKKPSNSVPCVELRGRELMRIMAKQVGRADFDYFSRNGINSSGMP